MARFFSGPFAPVVNAVQRTFAFRWLMDKMTGTDKRRVLPGYANESLENWYKKRDKRSSNGRKVVLFADTYINYHETDTGKAAIELLESCGYDVELAAVGCCQRPRISNGFLKKAKEDGTDTAMRLKPYFDQGLTVVVCEPSCTSALLDDLADLVDDETLARQLKNQVKALDVFLAEEYNKGHIKGRWVSKADNILLHGHCHQKASFGTSGMKTIFGSVDGLSFTEPDTGCCGMAGSFGYEKEHHDISEKIAGRILMPEIQKTNPDTLIVANGFSCRHQIADFSKREAVHWVESIRFEPE
jgi:Fe-S oxidoreductase